MRFAIKFCYRFNKTAPEPIKLIKETYKDKFFGMSMIFKWHDDL